MKYNFSIKILLLLFVAFGFSGMLLMRCTSGENQSAKFQQYYVQGEVLYTQHCSNCHQKDGTGLGLLYPPVNTSDYMKDHLDDVLCLIKHGTSGKMVVNGKSFNHEMPGLPLLTELEIAEITTYIYNSWGRQHGLVDVTKVSRTLMQCETSGIDSLQRNNGTDSQ